MLKIKERFQKYIEALGNDHGFSFMEIMITVTIIAILSGVGITIYSNYISRTKVQAAKSQIKQFQLPLTQVDTLPSTEEGLQKLVDEGFIPKRALKDPWGTPYQYQSPGDNGEDYVIYSYGEDKKEGGEGADKEIYSTELE